MSVTARTLHQLFANGRAISRMGGRTRPERLMALAAMTGLGAVLGVLGPFGSFLNDGVGLRIAYWIGTIWISLPIYGVCLWAARALAQRTGLPAWSALAAAVVLGSAPQAFIVSRVANGLWPGVISLTPLEWCVQVLITSALVVGVLVLVRRAWPRPAPAATPTSQSDAAVETAGALLCLQMEDHYVRVHRRDGARLVHGTMADIIAREARSPGLRVHRSWWVARSAVAEVVAEGRSFRLRLVNGLIVPVSRARVAALRTAGWL